MRPVLDQAAGALLGRPGEQVDIATLGEPWPERVDMLTIVLIGNSETRTVTAGGRTWVFTPRGYAAKAVRQAKTP